jgi:hypothetical protein
MTLVLRRSAPNHLQALRISSMLTARWHRMRQEIRPTGGSVYEPEAIVRLLNEAKVSFVLMGTHGVVGWRSESRATHDVDVLVSKRDHAKAVRAILEAYPHLKIHDEANVVTRFVEPATQSVVVDLMKPTSELYRSVFRHTHRVGKKYRIPDLEMALVCKYAAMKSETRRFSKKSVDLGDFADMVEHNDEIIDLDKVKRLAEKIKPGAGEAILKAIEDIKAGRSVRF